MTLFHRATPKMSSSFTRRVGDSACAAWTRTSVSSTTSATTTEVSSSLPPKPIGHSDLAPVCERRVFACAAMTMHCARWPRTWSEMGSSCPSRAVLQRSTSSLTKRLSKTPFVPAMMMSPSFAKMQVTVLPCSMTSTVMASRNMGSIRVSTRVTCSEFFCLSSRRLQPEWLTTSSGCPRSPRRSTSSWQSPTETMLTIGQGLPMTLVLLSMRASITVAEPWVSVLLKASLSNGTGPL
mmetsp:Transcript_45606/g.117937  ORF Transcript_45606/g.117937 Transcript_45606/m.117937 type:complete len:237 (+) Transcript_45606:889-1599(+)